MSSLFADRVRVAIADARSRSDLQGYVDARAARTAMALDGHTDVPHLARQSISEAVSARGDEEAQGRLLEAFWRSFAHLHTPVPATARLWVNAPEAQRNESHTFGYRTQPWITGWEGNQITEADFSNPIVVSSVQGESTGYFDDVTLYWDYKINVDALVSTLAPQSTVTLVRPRPDKHAFWMGWCDLDMNFNGLFSVLEQKYRVVPVTQLQNDEALTSIFGLEYKE